MTDPAQILLFIVILVLTILLDKSIVSSDIHGFYVPIISLFSNQGIPSKCQTTSNHNQFLGVTADELGKPSHPIVNISGSF
jgi:hypothetical protein